MKVILENQCLEDIGKSGRYGYVCASGAIGIAGRVIGGASGRSGGEAVLSMEALIISAQMVYVFFASMKKSFICFSDMSSIPAIVEM